MQKKQSAALLQAAIIFADCVLIAYLSKHPDCLICCGVSVSF